MDTLALEASMAQMNAAMAARGSEAEARTAALQDHGLPWPLGHRVHPVWEQALREATQEERRWDIETGPLLPGEHEARWFVMEDVEAERAASAAPTSLAYQASVAGRPMPHARRWKSRLGLFSRRSLSHVRTSPATLRSSSSVPCRTAV